MLKEESAAFKDLKVCKSFQSRFIEERSACLKTLKQDLENDLKMLTDSEGCRDLSYPR